MSAGYVVPVGDIQSGTESPIIEELGMEFWIADINHNWDNCLTILDKLDALIAEGPKQLVPEGPTTAPEGAEGAEKWALSTLC